MIGLDLGEILEIGSIASDITKHRDNLAQYIESFVNSNEALESYLVQIDKDIVKGFKNLISEANENQYLDQWSAISATLTHVHDQRKSYAKVFSSATPDNQGNYKVITDNGDKVPFINWAIGPLVNGHHTGGVLEEMYGWLNIGEIKNQTLSSLYDIFENVPSVDPSKSSGGTNTYGHNAINLLLEIMTTAQAFTGGTVNSSYSTNLQTNSLYSFQEAIYKLITSVFFTHDAVLNFLIQTSGSDHGRQSAHSLLVNNFGTSATEGTVWHKFATAMASLPQGSPTEQLLKTAFNARYINPTNTMTFINSDPVGAGNGPGHFRWCPYEFKLSDYHTNAFVSSIAFVELQWQGSNYENWVYVGLQAKVTQVGPGLSFTPMINPVPHMKDLNAPENWAPLGGYPTMENYTGCFKMTTYNGNYVTAPANPHTDKHIQVITGFKLGAISSGEESNLVVLLQFGILDVSDPQNPTVTVEDDTYYAPEWSGQMAIQQNLNSNFVGNLGASTVQDQNTGIITNITLDRQHGGPNCFNVQLFPTAFDLDMFQPANVTPVIAPSGAPAS